MSTEIEELKARHAELEQLLDTEGSKPFPDRTVVANIKKQKLKIKDQIARLEHA